MNMQPPRVRKGKLYDSAYGSAADFPTPASCPPPSMRPAQDSSLDIDVGDDVVAVAVESTPLRTKVLSALSAGQHAVAGPDALGAAAVVVVDGADDLAQRVGDVRRTARPDAAVVVVLAVATAEHIAAALQAGAFACLHPPFVPQELLGAVTSALDSRAAKVKAADLARKLDLESHLASIGRMTAGLSHEISNPLSAAILSVGTARAEIEQLLQAKGLTLDAVPDLRTALDDAAAAHTRLRGLLGAMRALVRRDRTAKEETVDVLKVVESVRSWLAEELGGIQVELLGATARARADSDMLGQILHNLVSNAANAARLLPSPRIRLHVYESGDRVIASVRDNGPGIPVEIHDRIFEPFFTTRRGTGGTGLGLALCLEYAHQIGAELSFWSLPGRGTCFRVALRRG